MKHLSWLFCFSPLCDCFVSTYKNESADLLFLFFCQCVITIRIELHTATSSACAVWLIEAASWSLGIRVKHFKTAKFGTSVEFVHGYRRFAFSSGLRRTTNTGDHGRRKGRSGSWLPLDFEIKYFAIAAFSY